MAPEVTLDPSSHALHDSVKQEPSSPSRKRRHSEDEDGEADTTVVDDSSEAPAEKTKCPAKKTKRTYKKHERYWALDGNVVIQLEDTRFKLHRSRLALQSPLFEALFEKHAGRDASVEGDIALNSISVEDEEDGIVVYLDSTDVALEDFLELLTAMEDTSIARRNSPFRCTPPSFRAASPLRFDKFAEHAKKAMTGPPHGFPEDLASLTEVGRYYIVNAILLGRNWNVPEILKRAFYKLARLSGSEDRRIPNPALNPPESGIDALDPIDLALLLNAQKKLAQAWAKVLLLHDLPRYKKCGDANCEASTTKYLYRAVHESGIGEEYALDPLCGLQALINAKWVNSYHHCQTCAKRRKSELAEKRKELWASLDGWLDI